jgi:hypothetical protein
MKKKRRKGFAKHIYPKELLDLMIKWICIIDNKGIG